MTITTVPLYSGAMPDRNSQNAATFTTNYIDWLNYQPTNITGMNVAVGEINLATAQVTSEKNAAAVSAAAAKVSEDNAANTANQRGDWSNLTGAASPPFAVYHQGSAWVLLNSLSNITTSEPGVSSAWAATSEQFSFKSSAFTITNNCNCSIDASGSAVDAAFLTSYAVGTVLTIHNESISTNLVRLTNTALTIRGAKGNLTPADNLVLGAGDTAKIIMKTATTGVFV
ncbi:MAG: hypothetical protein GY738_26530 [Pseudoalteromonas sp.]|nr:hypothetical protein [Pseudoalteromonas sp.]